MKIRLFISFIIGSIGLGIAQPAIREELKNTSYPRQGNDNLKKEWNNGSGGIIQSSDVSDEYVIEDKQAYSDSILAHYHEKYQQHLSKQLVREKNLLKEPELPEMPTFGS
jgi:hypothetical protein